MPQDLCLITGVAGFIGSNIANELLKRGFQVFGVDCFTDYYARSLKENNLKNLLLNKDFRFLEGDILRIELTQLFENISVVFHSAAQAGVRSSWGRDFQIYTQNNILATQRLLEAAKTVNLKKFIYASSSSVYGDCKEYPLKEDSYPLPVSPYGVSKLAAEQLCYLYWKNYTVPTISLRYFTVFGPGQRPDMAFNRFICMLLAGEHITMYGDGEQTRDFTYISDIVEANMLAMESPHEGKVYNIGGGSRVSVNHCIEILEKVSGLKAKIRNESFCKGDMQHTWADITRAQRELGYQPKFSLEEGLSNEFFWLQSIERSWRWE